MKSLAKKDVPWICGVMFAGLVAMVLSLSMSSFVDTFVVTPRHYEELFYTAWPSGLLLGVVAACFDEALRTREFFAQRPVSARAIAGSRLVACGIVLAAWFAIVPTAAYAAFVFDREWEVGHWQQLPTIWATMTPAISGCAIGLAAGSLPFVWWGRLVCLGALFFVPYSAIYSFERGGGRNWSSLSFFAIGHLVLAAAACFVAFAAAQARRDADRPLVPSLRMRIVAPLLAVFGVLTAVVCGTFAGEWVTALHNVYPRAVEHDGRVVLSAWDPAARGSGVDVRVVVDEHHVPTGERLAHGPRRAVLAQRWWQRDFFRIEPPRLRAAESTGVGLLGRLFVEADGRVLWQPLFVGGLRWIVKPDGSAFAPGARSCGRVAEGETGIAELGSDGVWLLDHERATVRHVPLPNADRVQGTTTVGGRSEFVGVPAGLEFLAHEVLVRGARGAYALRDGQLVAAGAPAPREEQKNVNWNGRIVDPDPLTWTLEFDGADGVPPFRHTFTPRTANERGAAAFVVALSMVRPPVLQLLATTHQPDSVLYVLPSQEGVQWWQPQWWWVFDPMVAGGRRIWLVLASTGIAALCAWLVRVLLRGLGADAAALRYWTIATLLLGPVAALMCLACETKRAWADRRVRVPAPTPRIVTPELQEIVA